MTDLELLARKVEEAPVTYYPGFGSIAEVTLTLEQQAEIAAALRDCQRLRILYGADALTPQQGETPRG